MFKPSGSLWPVFRIFIFMLRAGVIKDQYVDYLATRRDREKGMN